MALLKDRDESCREARDRGAVRIVWENMSIVVMRRNPGLLRTTEKNFKPKIRAQWLIAPGRRDGFCCAYLRPFTDVGAEVVGEISGYDESAISVCRNLVVAVPSSLDDHLHFIARFLHASMQP